MPDNPSPLLNGVSGITLANMGATKAALLAGNAVINFIGDSTTAQNSTLRTEAPSYQLGPLLAARLPGPTINNESFIGTGGKSIIAEYETYDPHVVLNSGTIVLSEHGRTAGTFNHALTTGATRYTPGFTFNRFRLDSRLVSTGATVTWLDSTGASGAVGGVGSSPLSTVLVCGDGATWIEFRSSTTNPVRYWGGYPYTNGQNYIHLLNAGWGGSRVANWVENVNLFDPLKWPPIIVPTCTEINIVINDANDNLASATYKTRLGTLIDAWKAVGDVYLRTGNCVDPASAAGPNLLRVVDDLIAVAVSKNVPVVRTHLTPNGGDWTAANAVGKMFDAYHCNALGAADIAAAQFEFYRQVLDGVPASGGGIGHSSQRRKVMLPDGRVVTPKDQRDFQRIIAEILGPEPTPVLADVAGPKKLRKAKTKVTKAIVAGPASQPIPPEFWARLETIAEGLVKSTEVLNAWQAYLSAQEDEEELELLLLAG